MYVQWKFACWRYGRSSAHLRAASRSGGSCRAPPYSSANLEEDGDSPGCARDQSGAPLEIPCLRSRGMDRFPCIIGPERFRTPRLRKELNKDAAKKKNLSIRLAGAARAQRPACNVAVSLSGNER